MIKLVSIAMAQVIMGIVAILLSCCRKQDLSSKFKQALRPRAIFFFYLQILWLTTIRSKCHNNNEMLKTSSSRLSLILLLRRIGFLLAFHTIHRYLCITIILDMKQTNPIMSLFTVTPFLLLRRRLRLLL